MIYANKSSKISKIFSNPKYRGRHVVVAGDRVYSSATGNGVVKILDRLNKDHPKIIPEISYIPKPRTLILWM
ncbi:hypothetical protein COT50_03155 [candidate division WWE3 bacterium CG08_land_8_20_14_0_20_41_10]|uniref:DUF5678 domain-containing protein n=1 Tax=candidate division WWE3 bacterium CG08_land_8_20_14_0_20_41_10 TaxID=1975085 RepID=A0A2H0XBB0_UNCKA|nr:MAG: hypothetical protein COT50_03155 [candidate division WWE3 bacterium CG08_land_8_20_14_0_20_41_10]